LESNNGRIADALKDKMKIKLKIKPTAKANNSSQTNELNIYKILNKDMD